MAKKRYGALIRVSKVGQRKIEDLRSPDIQRATIAAFAVREGIDVEFFEPDINVSGAKAERETVNAIVGRVEAGDLDGLVVSKLDRLSRLAPRQRVELFERIEERAGGRVMSASENNDLSTPEGRFAREIFLGIARMQWEQHREAFAERASDAVAAGCHAHPPFGYRKPMRRGKDGEAEVDRRKPLQVIPEEAVLVRELFARRAHGLSWSELRRFADEHGPPPRRSDHWSRRGVENIVHNRAYLGEARYGSHVNPDAHPAVVSADEFEAAQVARGVRPPRGDAALLSGLVRCAGCRHRMRAATVGSRKQRVYRCRVDHGSGRCPNPASVTLELLDDLVTSAFLGRYSDVEVIAADVGLAEATRAVQDTEHALGQYLAAISIDDVGEAAFAAGARARRDKVSEARAALAHARAQAGGMNFGAAGLAVWPELDIGARRRLLGAGVDAVFVRRAPVHGRHVLDDDRVRVFWRGEAPDGLPGPGVRVEVAGLDW